MTREEAKAIIQQEYQCVDRDCDRECGKCDLMMPSKEPILKAYKMAIQALEQDQKSGEWIEYTRVLIPEPFNRWEQAWYCSKCGYGNQECEDGSAWLEWKYCPNCGAKNGSEG